VSIKIDDRSGAIALEWGGVKPDVHKNKSVCTFHMGKGFKPPATPFSRVMEDQGSAFTATGLTRVEVGPQDSMVGWRFGFLQMVRHKRWETHYVGRTPKDGSIGINHLQVIGDKFLLDASPSDNPYASHPVLGAAMKPPLLRSSFEDAPIFMFRMDLINKKTLGKNLLFSAALEREFVTILSLQRPDGVFFHMAHFKWFLRHEIKITRWAGTKDDADPTNVSINADATKLPAIVAGAPSELAQAGLTFNGAEPIANDKMDEAIRRVKGPVATSEASHNDNWFANVPANFFTPR